MGISTLLDACSNLNTLMTNEMVFLSLFAAQFIATVNLSPVNIFDLNCSGRVLGQETSQQNRPGKMHKY